jgi:hypothetical protein
VSVIQRLLFFCDDWLLTRVPVLNALAGRSGSSIVSGDILFDGHVPDSDFYRKNGYVEQLDMHGLRLS